MRITGQIKRGQLQESETELAIEHLPDFEEDMKRIRPKTPRRQSSAIPRIAVLIAVIAAATPIALWFGGINTQWPHTEWVGAQWLMTAAFGTMFAAALVLFCWSYFAQRELLQLRSRFQAVSETAREYVWEIDEKGRFVFLTSRAEHMFGLKIEELLGQQLHMFMPEEEAFAMRHWASGLLKNPKPFSEVEFRTTHPYSGIRWQQISGEPIMDSSGNVRGYRGVGLDVTDRKLVEDAQRENLELLQTLLDTIPSAISYKDLEGRYLGCNETLIKWLGRSREHILGRTDHQLYPTDLADIYRKHDQELLLEPGRCRYESEFGVMGGPRRDALMHTGTFCNAQGQVAGLVSVVTDISDRKQGEKDLLDAKRAAETASRAKDEFIANMSHEFRTPLTAILGFADVLLENLHESENFHAAKTIKRNGSHLLEIVNDILDITKIQAGKLRSERAPCSPLRIMADMMSLMSVRAEAKGLSLKVRQEGPLPEVIVTDMNRLRQILVNLIGNAIKFTETGGVDVIVRFLKSAADGKSHKLEFEVVDTGIGMSSEQMEQMFRPFTQADTSTTRRYGGTGLGLIISHRLAHILGGDVTVSSVLSKGCSFRVTIETGPVDNVRMVEGGEIKGCRGAELLENDEENFDKPIKLDCRVLLVEDGPDNQRLISFLLRKVGATVEIASNGLEGIKKALPSKFNTEGTNSPAEDSAAENLSEDASSGQVSSGSDTNQDEPFDIVLMDMQMPVMGGEQATQRLRQANYRGPIICISAHSTPNAVESALEAGCDEFLSKPIDKNRLLRSIANHLACRSLAPRGSIR